MHYSESRSRSEAIFVMTCLVFVFICAAALLGLRLRAANLEKSVASAAAKIERCKDENALLERKCSMLLAPLNVSAYAREQLNMAVEQAAEVVYVDANSVETAKEETGSIDVAAVSSFDRFNPFVDKAHAKN